MAANLLDTVLLLALPASGKSEVRTYMSTLSQEQCENEFHVDILYIFPGLYE